MKKLTYCLVDHRATLAGARSLSPQQVEHIDRLPPSQLHQSNKRLPTSKWHPFAILILITCVHLTTLAQAESGAPKVFLLKANDLITTRERINAGDHKTQSALAKLRVDAEKAL